MDSIALNDTSIYERLFLLEFMVHEVCYACACTMDENFLQSLGPTCVCFNADSFPVISVSEDEFGKCGPYNSFTVKFTSGKSSIFSMKGGSESCVSNKARINVSRKIGGNCISDFKFGTAYLKLSPDFLSVLCSRSPCSKCISVSLDMINEECRTIGTVAIFLRLSYFGTSIISQFQEGVPTDSKYFQFRGDKVSLAKFSGNASACKEESSQPCSSCQNESSCCYQQVKAEMLFDLIKMMRSDTALSILFKDNSFSQGDKHLNQFPTESKQETLMLGDHNYPETFLNNYPSHYMYNPGQIMNSPEGMMVFPSGYQEMLMNNYYYNQSNLSGGISGHQGNLLQNYSAPLQNCYTQVQVPSMTGTADKYYRSTNQTKDVPGSIPPITYKNNDVIIKQVSKNILAKTR